MASGPLDGIRVLDFTNFQQGPSATALLSDMGAEVIKIERPGIGDLGRLLSVRENGFSTYFHTHCRGKRSVTVNLKRAEGLEIVYRLARTADVVVDNFQGGTMDRLGLSYDRLSAINPRIICATASGFGPEGPRASSPSYAPIGLAVGGAYHATWRGDAEPPGVQGIGGVSDQVGGMILAFAISSALVARERSGVGQRVDTSQYGSQLNMMCASINNALYRDSPPPEVRPGIGLSGIFRCADGKHVTMGFLPSNKGDKWIPLCDALGWPDWQHDPAFGSQRERDQRMPEIRARLDETLLTRTAREWVECFDRWDIPSGLVQDYDDIAADPQALANDYITEVDDRKWGRQTVVGVVARMSKTPGAVQGLAPELGADNVRYLREAGYSDTEIARLGEVGAI
ncbi:MAG: CoA transferase [Chloroflexi bacterium]|nr:CoA transferase [Chloroflexota bacterium]MDA1003451.1 CoA transferase [Chloroflexota bacterium]